MKTAETMAPGKGKGAVQRRVSAMPEEGDWLGQDSRGKG